MRRLGALAAVLAVVACSNACSKSEDAASSPPPCVEPSPVLVADVDTGFDKCKSDAHGGFFVRRAIVACPPPGAGSCAALGPDGGAAGSSCATDAECKDQPNGRCDVAGGACGCVYPCQHDSDCLGNAVCECGASGGTCIPATCKDASSCTGGGQCAVYYGATCAARSYACTASKDTCLVDDDCKPASDGSPTRCTFTDGARSCTPGKCDG